jgi:hypothetical protein
MVRPFRTQGHFIALTLQDFVYDSTLYETETETDMETLMEKDECPIGDVCTTEGLAEMADSKMAWEGDDG